jgi:hypothetical protein
MTATWLDLSVTREECSDALRDEYYSFYASWVCDLSGGDRYQGIGVFKGGYQGLLDPRTPSKAQGTPVASTKAAIFSRMQDMNRINHRTGFVPSPPPPPPSIRPWMSLGKASFDQVPLPRRDHGQTYWKIVIEEEVSSFWQTEQCPSPTSRKTGVDIRFKSLPQAIFSQKRRRMALVF